MLRKFNTTRSESDNLKLGILTAFTAGMVNVASLIIFFSFTSNITGNYAILAQEISNGNWFKVLIVLFWIVLFFSGSFLSSYIIINGKHMSRHLSHALPLVIEFLCLISVGVYGVYFYEETLMETEYLVAVLLFAMGLQNGLTASISNFAIKTTHLTGLTTDLAIHLSMISQEEFRGNKTIKNKIKLLTSILCSYLTGGIIAGSITHYFEFKVFFYVSFAIAIIIFYDRILAYYYSLVFSARKKNSKTHPDPVKRKTQYTL